MVNITVEHNFSTLFSYDNPLVGAIVEVNNSTSHMWAYSTIFLIFVISAYVITRKTQDVPKGFIHATHISTLLTLLLFYGGKTAGITIVSEVFMLALIIGEALAIGGMFYMRHSKNQ